MRRAMVEVVGLGIVLVSACSRHRFEPGAAAAPAAEALTAPDRSIPAEHGHYTLHVADVLIGRGELHVQPAEPDGDGDRGLVRVTSVIESDGIADAFVEIRDEVSTVLDVATGMPVATRGGFVTLLTGRSDPGVAAGIDKPWTEEGHNGHSLLFALRRWTAKPGARSAATLVSRAKDYRVDLVFRGRELLETALGTFPTLRIDGTIHGAASDGDPFHFVLWTADDPTRAILRLDTDTDFKVRASARIVEYSTAAE
jgi:hypothetical protein